MPADDYTPAATGALKLKGAHSSSKVSKHKKKRPKPPPDSDKSPLPSSTTDPTSTKSSHDKNTEDLDIPAAEEKDQNSRTNSQDRQTLITQGVKTEAELRYEERRRKRSRPFPQQLDERLKREGLKTHKERVEELNRYLSNLSEHHDMPRIGPG
ncbi:MAG: hypothetical protein LQ351_007020 [Letrouitia transgressa]|nr:MAG: hypothetical protein LQ351_007020 [Letrouitia transgressa]